MSILNTSVSGMQGNSNWLSTISQNVANSNTTGYKNVETDFSEPGRSDRQRRGGFRRRLHEPGLAQRAPGQCHLHFDDDRPRRPGRRVFRRVRLQRHLYLTRNGSFTPDASGNLVNSAGYYLMAANVQNGVSPLAANSLTDLVRRSTSSTPAQTATPTTTASLTANLPSTATPVAPANLPSANSASSTYTEATSLVVYDNLGASHTINLLLHQHRVQHLGGRRVRCVEQRPPSGGFPYSSGPLATQTLTFNPTNGALSSGSTLSLTVPNGQPMNLDLSHMTQLAAGFNVTAATANGNAPSGISGVSISTSGSLTFNYANGTSNVAYDIPLANVVSPDNLASVNGGAYLQTSASGPCFSGPRAARGLA